MDRPTIKISCVNISDIDKKQYKCIAWKKINCQSSGAFSNNIYMMNNNFSSITLDQMQYNDNIMISHIKLSQILKQHPGYLLFI